MNTPPVKLYINVQKSAAEYSAMSELPVVIVELLHDCLPAACYPSAAIACDSLSSKVTNDFRPRSQGHGGFSGTVTQSQRGHKM